MSKIKVSRQDVVDKGEQLVVYIVSIPRKQIDKVLKNGNHTPAMKKAIRTNKDSDQLFSLADLVKRVEESYD